VKRLSFLLFSVVVFLTLFLFPFPADANRDVTVLLDGLPVYFDVLPVILNGRTLVPFRLIAEALNVKVDWDSSSRTVIANDSGKTIVLQVDNSTAYINNVPIILDVAPIIINGRTLIPMRFFTESLNCDVKWVGESRTVEITSPSKAMEVVGFYALGDSQTSSWTNLFGTPYPDTARGNTDIVTGLALGWYTVNEKGDLLTQSPRTAWRKPSGWQDILAAANLYSLNTEMVIHETDRGGLLTTLLDDQLAMTGLVRQIMAEVVYFKGVNLDLEGLGPSGSEEQLQSVQQKFNYFVSLLATELRSAGKTLTLTLHPPNSYYRGYDYRRLGELADRIIIMAYDYGPKPEPVDKVQRAVEMAAAVVPRQKLLLGISMPSETP
jgi:hypothetical protein